MLRNFGRGLFSRLEFGIKKNSARFEPATSDSKELNKFFECLQSYIEHGIRT